MPWTREQMAERAVKELRDGMYANCGIGIPTLINNCAIPEGVMLQNENGMLGMGPFPYEGDEDPDIISAGKQTITEIDRTSYFDEADSFAMIRGGHLDMTFIGGMQVSERGDLASWIVPGGLVKGPGGSMDLVAGAKRVCVLMEHVTKDGKPRLLRNCTYPLTGVGVVDLLITNLGVFSFDGGFVCEEMADGVEIDEIRSKSDAEIRNRSTQISKSHVIREALRCRP